MLTFRGLFLVYFLPYKTTTTTTTKKTPKLLKHICILFFKDLFTEGGEGQRKRKNPQEDSP